MSVGRIDNESQDLVEFSQDAFREDYNNDEKDLLAQVPHLEKLAKKYLKKSRTESSDKSWISIVRSHALVNACLARDGDTKKWHPERYQIEQEFHNGSMPWFMATHSANCKKLKERLEKVRTTMKKLLDPAKIFINDFDTINVQSEKNWELVEDMGKIVFVAHDNCTKGMLQFSAVIIKMSEEIVGTPPCAYSAVALGSLARGEATPYSDLEYLFLVESNEHMSYFQKLAITSYFLIANLGETPLKTMSLEEIYEDKDNKEKKWFNDFTKNGFKIDGFGKKAGHMPTGGEFGSDSLIKTPEKLSIYYKKKLEKKLETEEPGDMSDLLSSSVEIHCYGNKQLLKKFEQSRKEVNNKFKDTADYEKLKNVQWSTMLEDAKKYSDFIPNFKESFGSKQRELKADIFRYPTLLLYNLGRFFDIEYSTSHEVLEDLFKKRILCQPVYRALYTMLTIALYMRSHAYLSFESQKEQLSFLTSTVATSPSSERHHFSRELLLTMAVAMMQVKKWTFALGKHKCYDLLTNFKLRTLNLPGFDGILMDTVVPEVYFFCADYKGCLQALQALLKPIDLSQHQSVVNDIEMKYKAGSEEAETLVYMLADAHEMTAAYKISYEYKQQMHCNNNAASLFRLGRLCNRLGDFSKADDFFKSAIVKYAEQGNENGIESAEYECVNNQRDMGRYEEAIQHYEGKLQLLKLDSECTPGNIDIAVVYFELGTCYIDLAEYQKAIDHYDRALKLNKNKYGRHADHADIANTHLGLANVFSYMMQYKNSVEEYECALHMNERLYGVGNGHPDVAAIRYGLGTVYMEMGQYALAEDQYNSALNMYTELGDYLGMASSRHEMGRNCNLLGQHAEAEKQLKESLQMKKRIYGTDAKHKSIAITLCRLGNNYHDSENLAEALEHLELSFVMYKALFSNGNSDPVSGQATKHLNQQHPGVAAVHHGLGDCYRKKFRYEEAAKHLRFALEIYEQIYAGQRRHISIAAVHYSLGLLCLLKQTEQQQLTKASCHLQEAVHIMADVFGEDSRHPLLLKYKAKLGKLKLSH